MHTDLSAFTARCALFPLSDPDVSGLRSEVQAERPDSFGGEGEQARTIHSRIGPFPELSNWTSPPEKPEVSPNDIDNTAVESADPVDIKRKVRRPVMVRFRCALVEFRCFRRLCLAATGCRLAHRTHRRGSEGQASF